MSKITTYQGIRMDPLNAREEDIHIKDVAHALSLLCRANGHFPYFYSVAQHCLNCAEEARVRGYSTKVQLGCLLHDASEAYLSDVIRPIKPHLTGYYEIEERLQDLIFSKWLPSPLTEDERQQVFEIDDAMLYHEFFMITGQRVTDPVSAIQSNSVLELVEFREMEQNFLKTFEQLVRNP